MAAEPKVTATLWRGVKADIANEYPKGKKFRCGASLPVPKMVMY